MGTTGLPILISESVIPSGGVATVTFRLENKITREILIHASTTAAYPYVPLDAGDDMAYARLDSSQYHLASPLVPFTVH